MASSLSEQNEQSRTLWLPAQDYPPLRKHQEADPVKTTIYSLCITEQIVSSVTNQRKTFVTEPLACRFIPKLNRNTENIFFNSLRKFRNEKKKTTWLFTLIIKISITRNYKIHIALKLPHIHILDYILFGLVKVTIYLQGCLAYKWSN